MQENRQIQEVTPFALAGIVQRIGFYVSENDVRSCFPLNPSAARAGSVLVQGAASRYPEREPDILKAAEELAEATGLKYIPELCELKVALDECYHSSPTSIIEIAFIEKLVTALHLAGLSTATSGQMKQNFHVAIQDENFRSAAINLIGHLEDNALKSYGELTEDVITCVKSLELPLQDEKELRVRCKFLSGVNFSELDPKVERGILNIRPNLTAFKDASGRAAEDMSILPLIGIMREAGFEVRKQRKTDPNNDSEFGFLTNQDEPEQDRNLRLIKAVGFNMPRLFDYKEIMDFDGPVVAKLPGDHGGTSIYFLETREQKATFLACALIGPSVFQINQNPGAIEICSEAVKKALRGELEDEIFDSDRLNMFTFEEYIETPGDYSSTFRIVADAFGNIQYGKLNVSTVLKSQRETMACTGAPEADNPLGIRAGMSFLELLDQKDSPFFINRKNIVSNHAQGGTEIILDGTPATGADAELLLAIGISPDNPTIPYNIAIAAGRIGRLCRSIFPYVGIDFIPNPQDKNGASILEINIAPAVSAKGLGIESSDKGGLEKELILRVLGFSETPAIYKIYKPQEVLETKSSLRFDICNLEQVELPIYYFHNKERELSECRTKDEFFSQMALTLAEDYFQSGRFQEAIWTFRRGGHKSEAAEASKQLMEFMSNAKIIDRRDNPHSTQGAEDIIFEGNIKAILKGQNKPGDLTDVIAFQVDELYDLNLAPTTIWREDVEASIQIWIQDAPITNVCCKSWVYPNDEQWKRLYVLDYHTESGDRNGANSLYRPGELLVAVDNGGGSFIQDLIAREVCPEDYVGVYEPQYDVEPDDVPHTLIDRVREVNEQMIRDKFEWVGSPGLIDNFIAKHNRLRATLSLDTLE